MNKAQMTTQNEDLVEILNELDAAAQDSTGDQIDRFAVLLDKWDAYESLRLSAQEDFHLRAALGVDRNQLARVYADAKKRVLAVEQRLLEVFRSMDATQRSGVLDPEWKVMLSYPAVVKIVMLKAALRERLEEKNGK